VINRGNQHAVVFHDDWHYWRFVDTIGHFDLGANETDIHILEKNNFGPNSLVLVKES
jgi:hypothetical protein